MRRTALGALAIVAALGAAALFFRRPWSRGGDAASWQETQRRYYALRGTTGPIEQRRVIVAWEGRPVEERCTTCHLGATDPAMRAAPRELGTHPDLERLLARHPPDRFGCVGCHGGDGADVTARAHEGLRPRSGCGTCHSREEALEGAPEISEGRALFRLLRCGACHSVSRADPLRVRAAPLDDIAAKTTPEHLLRFLRSPRASLPRTTMPTFWPPPLDPATRAPLAEGAPGHAAWLARKKTETLSVAAYLLAKSERDAPRWADGSPRASEIALGRANVPGASADDGARIFAVVGCVGCHASRDDAAPLQSRARDAVPSLAEAGARLREDWMAWFLEDPARAHERSAMPSLRLDRRDAASIAKHLAARGGSKPTEPVDPAELAVLTDPARRSERVRCNVSEGGAADETTRAECGERLYASYGCGACHGGPKTADVPLDGYAARGNELDWGQVPHDEKEAPSRAWEAYTTLLLDAPRVFSPGARLMPDYDLSAREIRALVAYLASLAGRAPSKELDPYARPERLASARGATLIADLGCRACHAIGGAGGDYLAARRALEGEVDEAMVPPPLTHEGARVRGDWLASFLRDPGSRGVRPALHPEWVWGSLVPLGKLAPRMPTFALDAGEVELLVRALGADGPPGDAGSLSADDRPRAIAQVLGAPLAGGGCMRCHYAGELPVDRAKTSLAELAPDLSATSGRLRPEWVRAFLSSPRTFVPDTPMPGLEGDPMLVTSLLFSLGPGVRLAPAEGGGDRAWWGRDTSP